MASLLLFKQVATWKQGGNGKENTAVYCMSYRKRTNECLPYESMYPITDFFQPDHSLVPQTLNNLLKCYACQCSKL